MEKLKPISLLMAMFLLSVPSLTAFAQDSDEEELEAELTYDDLIYEPTDEELTYDEESTDEESTDEESTDEELTYLPADDMPLCDPSYPYNCIPPPPPDLNCGDEGVPAAEFTVLPPDPHGFDDDYDGLGCESNIPEPTSTSTTTLQAAPTDPTLTTGDNNNNINNPPEAYDVTVTTNAGQPIDIQLSASDIDNDALTASITTPPLQGDLSSINQETGMVTYTPRAGFSISDSFMFKVNDGKADSNTALVTIAENLDQPQQQQTSVPPNATSNNTSSSSSSNPSTSVSDGLSTLISLTAQGVISEQDFSQIILDTAMGITPRHPMTSRTGINVPPVVLPEWLKTTIQECKSVANTPINLDEARDLIIKRDTELYKMLGYSPEEANQRATWDVDAKMAVLGLERGTRPLIDIVNDFLVGSLIEKGVGKGLSAVGKGLSNVFGKMTDFCKGKKLCLNPPESDLGVRPLRDDFGVNSQTDEIIISDDDIVNLSPSRNVDPRHARGLIGEALAADALKYNGHKVITYKPDISGTTTPGFDLITYKDGYAYLIDNKALTRSGNVASVSSLTTNFEKNKAAAIAQIKDLLSKCPDPSMRSDLEGALTAIENGKIIKAVTNANLTPNDKILTGVTENLDKNWDIKFIDVFTVER